MGCNIGTRIWTVWMQLYWDFYLWWKTNAYKQSIWQIGNPCIIDVHILPIYKNTPDIPAVYPIAFTATRDNKRVIGHQHASTWPTCTITIVCNCVSVICQSLSEFLDRLPIKFCFFSEKADSTRDCQLKQNKNQKAESKNTHSRGMHPRKKYFIFQNPHCIYGHCIYGRCIRRNAG